MTTNRYAPEALTESVLSRFNSKHTTGNGCWNWNAYKDAQGYGWLKVGKVVAAAHRISWVIANKKEWPTHLIARHTCNNPACVNPAHIVPGTDKENMDDRKQNGKAWQPANFMPKISCVCCKRVIKGASNLKQHYGFNHE